MSMVEDVSTGSPARRKAVFKRASGSCEVCGCSLCERRQGARFCSRSCKDSYFNRPKIQGAALINIAKRWRRFSRDPVKREKYKGDFTLMSRLLDQMIAQDIKDGIDTYPDPPLEAYQVVTKLWRRA